MVSKNSADISQKDKFKETARALGCDENEAAFDKKLGKLAKHKTAPAKPKEKQ